MRTADTLEFAFRVVRGYRSRTLLILLAMGIGVAAVVGVSTLGEGARLYIVNQFGSLGTNLVVVLPGRSETAGAMPGVLLGRTPRDLTLDDALALKRSAAVRRLAPLMVGAGDVRAGARSREAPVLGTTHELLEIRHMTMAQGTFLPVGDPRQSQPVCVLGSKLAAELFGSRGALGEWLRVGDRRFRVVGVMAPQGESLGFNTDEIVIVPVASAQMLFNTEALFRVLVEAKSREQILPAQADLEEILRERHEGKRDVTVITQDAVLATFDRILRALTLAVGALAAISLAVAGILIMNVMLISVTQRRGEIGLLRAIGASGAQIRAVFFTEAVLLALGGAALGLAAGKAGQLVVGQIFPAIPFTPPWWALIAAPLTAIGTAVVFAIAPARRAARLDPVQALSRR
jgi:putative ABC transport system permease protein